MNFFYTYILHSNEKIVFLFFCKSSFHFILNTFKFLLLDIISKIKKERNHGT